MHRAAKTELTARALITSVLAGQRVLLVSPTKESAELVLALVEKLAGDTGKEIRKQIAVHIS